MPSLADVAGECKLLVAFCHYRKNLDKKTNLVLYVVIDAEVKYEA
jgi:hypothetical protein